MDWIEVVVRTTTYGAEMVSEALMESGCNGTIIEDRNDVLTMQRPDGEWDYIDEAVLNRLEEDVLVKGYFAQNERLHDKLALLEQGLEVLRSRDESSIMGVLNYQLSNVKEEDWENGWKKYYKPFLPGKKIVIKPSWEEYQATEGQIVLEMDPGMAFGTGTHETTAMCVRMLEECVVPGMRLYDVGCGTGILGVSAALLGVAQVTAMDIDENSVRITNQNAERNHVSDKVHAHVNNLLQGIEEQVDLIVANIIADIIIRMAKDAGRLVKDNGLFISSGIIHERAAEVRTALERVGFTILRHDIDGEWTAFLAQKRVG